jgi:hypothetical protein
MAYVAPPSAGSSTAMSAFLTRNGLMPAWRTSPRVSFKQSGISSPAWLGTKSERAGGATQSRKADDQQSGHGEDDERAAISGSGV